MDSINAKIGELQELIAQVNEIAQTLEFLKIDDSDKIEYGCKVEVKYNDGSFIEGRVWGISKYGTAQVNRDGYKSYMNFVLSDLKNLSVGTIGKLEKAKWVKEQRIQTLTHDISQSRVNFIEFDIPILKRESLLRIEIIESKEIRNTTARLITFRKENDKVLHKVVSNELNLRNGLYNFYFFMGVLTRFEPVVNQAST